MMGVLRAEGLAVGYGRRILWQNLTFSLAPGEICVLMGKNGSGKTTLLRTLQGALPPLHGQIFWQTEQGSVDLGETSVRERAAILTTMAQEIPAAAGLTGFDFVEMGLYPARGPFARLTDADREHVIDAAERYGAAALLPAFLDRLSVGQRQMLSFLRAVVQNTPVLLLDEPASALDFGQTERLFDMVKALAAEGKAVLAVLHDPTMAIRVADRLLCLTDEGLTADIQAPAAHPDEAEAALRTLYPHLRLHRDPVFCYSELPDITKEFRTNLR